MTDPVSPVPARSPVWMRVALGLSLALNLAVAGVVAGAILRHDDPRREASMREPSGAPYLRALPPEDRRAIERQLRAELGPPRAAMQALRADFAEALALLRADAFDAAAFAATIDRQRSRFQVRAEAGDRLFVERLAGMTPEQRAELADRIEDRVRRFARPRD
jgi:uncharacterized membrane protein